MVVHMMLVVLQRLLNALCVLQHVRVAPSAALAS